MYTIIMLSGNPCSGKTTAANALVEYLKDHGRTVTHVSRSHGSYEANINVLELTLYKWFKERDSEFVVIDGPDYTVFDRADILKLIFDGMKDADIKRDDLVLVALNMSRAAAFTHQHNEDKGHRPYTKKSMMDLLRSYQQPINDEGFDMIYRVSGSDYLNAGHMFYLIEKAIGCEYGNLAVFTKKTETAVETTEADAADAAEEAVGKTE